METRDDPEDSLQLASDSLIERIRALELPEVLDLGQAPFAISRFWVGAASQRVVLIGERYVHLLHNHPDMKGYERAIVATALAPDCVHSNSRDPQMAVLYRAWQSGIQVRVALWVSDDPRFHNSIHSARFARLHERTKGVEKGRLIWEKG